MAFILIFLSLSSQLANIRRKGIPELLIKLVKIILRNKMALFQSETDMSISSPSDEEWYCCSMSTGEPSCCVCALCSSKKRAWMVAFSCSLKSCGKLAHLSGSVNQARVSAASVPYMYCWQARSPFWLSQLVWAGTGKSRMDFMPPESSWIYSGRVFLSGLAYIM